MRTKEEVDAELKLKRQEHYNILKMESENLKAVNKLMKEREKIQNELRDKARLGSEEERRWHY